jgi:hypothetical protein
MLKKKPKKGGKDHRAKACKNNVLSCRRELWLCRGRNKDFDARGKREGKTNNRDQSALNNGLREEGNGGGHCTFSVCRVIKIKLDSMTANIKWIKHLGSEAH